MKIVSNFNGDAEWSVVPYIHKSLLKFNGSSCTEVLMNRVEWIYNDEIKKLYKDYKGKAYWLFGVHVNLLVKKTITTLSIMTFLMMFFVCARLHASS